MDKEHILAEIRRTAGDNNGQPLGRARFFAATGIRDADWFGKFWIRWNQAVVEAGFEPNSLQGRRPDEDLLGRLAALVQELGHYPVTGELRIKARSDPTFPNPKTFGRFGNKRAVATRLEVFCTEQGQEDIAALCAVVATEDSDTSPQVATKEQPMTGFVYLIRSGKNYKLGRTNALGRRERELALQLPEKTKPVHSIRTDDPEGIEAYWQRRFQQRRKNGEWFELTPEDVSAFRRRKFQ